MNFYGLYHWWTDHQQSHEIKIISIAGQLVILQLLLSAVLGLLLGLTLKYWTDAAVPLLDAQLAAFSLLATYWTSRRYIATGCSGCGLILFMLECLSIKICC